MKITILITFIFFNIVISGQNIEFAEDRKERCTQLQKEITDLSDTDIMKKSIKMFNFSKECILTTKESIEQTNKIKDSLAKQDAERKAKIQPIIDQINNGICVPCKNDFGESKCLKVSYISISYGELYCPRKEFSECLIDHDCRNQKVCKGYISKCKRDIKEGRDKCFYEYHTFANGDADSCSLSSEQILN